LPRPLARVLPPAAGVLSGRPDPDHPGRCGAQSGFGPFRVFFRRPGGGDPGPGQGTWKTLPKPPDRSIRAGNAAISVGDPDRRQNERIFPL